MLKQLSIYAENKKGVMQNITGILKDEDINILGSVTNDSAEYGIVRMVVSEPDKAMYLSFNRDSGKPIMVFHTEDIMEVRACLKSRGYTVL